MSGRVRARPVAGADALVVATLALVGLRLGLSPLRDNSAFTHLATGIRMVHDGLLPAIPRVDPYSFTAAGHEWVVQSWLPSAAVGWVYRIVGEHGVTLLAGATTAALAWLVATLARTGRPGRTTIAACAALAVGAPLWAPRPLLVGLLCLGLMVLVVERRWSPWWLVAVVWVWVNSHGSFPLGLLWLVLVCLTDRRLWRYAGAFATGLAVAVVNPLGPKLLVFPLTALEKREVFARVVEWGRPDFASPEGVIALVGLVVAIGALWIGKAGWRDVLPVAVFFVLGLTAERNLAALGVVLAPALGRALRADPSEVARVAPDRARIVFAGMAVAALVVSVTALQRPLVDSSGYPVSAIVWLEDHDRFTAPHRVASTDRVGNFLELRHGARAEVFIDDRVDMFPVAVTKDYIAMRDGSERGVRALDRWHVDTVLWEADEPLVDKLLATDEWEVGVRRAAWVVLLRRDN